MTGSAWWRWRLLDPGTDAGASGGAPSAVEGAPPADAAPSAPAAATDEWGGDDVSPDAYVEQVLDGRHEAGVRADEAAAPPAPGAGEPAPEAPPDEAEAEAAPELTPDQWLERLEFQPDPQVWEQVPPALQPVVRQVLAAELQRHYEQRYAPAASYVAAEYQRVQQAEAEQQAYTRDLQEFWQKPAAQLALQIANTPGALERVQVLLTGGATSAPVAGANGNGNGQAGTSRLDLEALDPDSRAIYEQLDQRNTALQGQLQQVTQALAKIEEERAAFERDQQQQAGGAAYRGLMEQAQRDTGLSVASYPELWSGAWSHVMTYLKAGHLEKVPPQERQAVAHKLLMQGLELNGLRRIKAARKRQAANVVPPPGDRAAALATEPDDPDLNVEYQLARRRGAVR